MKIAPIAREGEEPYGWFMECPGCGNGHAIYTRERNDCGAIWTWDGNRDAPTFNPSILCRVDNGPDVPPLYVCHFFVRAGMIEYLNDCTHEYRGQKIPMPDLDAPLKS